MIAPAALPNPLLHEYVDAPDAVTLIDVVVHVNSVTPVLLVITVVGTLDDPVIIMLALAEHPFAVVPVTVYVPAAVMVALAVLPNPLLHV